MAKGKSTGANYLIHYIRRTRSQNSSPRRSESQFRSEIGNWNRNSLWRVNYVASHEWSKVLLIKPKTWPKPSQSSNEAVWDDLLGIVKREKKANKSLDNRSVRTSFIFLKRSFNQIDSRIPQKSFADQWSRTKRGLECATRPVWAVKVLK